MRTSIVLIFTIVFGVAELRSAGQTLVQKMPAFLKPNFNEGERLQYAIRYGFIKCGEATVSVLSNEAMFRGKKSIHFSATGQTSGSFNVFYRVRNRYDSYIDEKTFLPFSYTEDIHENQYKRNGEIDFNYQLKQVTTAQGSYPIEETTRDIVSAFYFARSLDLTAIKPGDQFLISYFLEGGVAPLVVSYLGKERITTELGTFDCLKYSPSLQPGRIFRKDSKMYLWITDDKNRVPLRARAEIIVGAVTMDLKSYNHLIAPLKNN